MGGFDRVALLWYFDPMSLSRVPLYPERTA